MYRAENMEERMKSCSTPIFALKERETKLF